MSEVTRHIGRLLAAILIAIAVTPVFVSPAQACSCATPTDIEEWVDESEAVFVGTLVEKRDGLAGEFGPESLYVFEVEQWVKGDAGGVIEVRSASDGAGCGFEFWNPDQRIGAAIYQENGELHGGLCSQIDPEVLLAAVEGPTPSATGIGHLLVADGWSSSRVTVVDEAGHHVIDLEPPGQDDASTNTLDACPGTDLVVQATDTEVFVWDLTTYEVAHVYPISAGWVSDISCRNPEASSIFVLTSDDIESELLEVVPEPTTILELEGTAGTIGTDHVVIQKTHEGDATRVDFETGAEIPLTSTPPDLLRSVSAASHPTESLVALVETTFHESGPVDATLSIVDGSGTVTHQFEIPWETYSPTWLDESRVAVQAYNNSDWEQSFGFVFDVESGATIEIEGWNAEHTVADGNLLYGVSGGSILTTDLTNPVVETLVTLPSQSAGPLLVMNEASPVAPTTTIPDDGEPEPTTPPLVAPGLESENGETGGIQWLAGAAIVTFLVLLVWLARRSPDEGG